MENYFRAVTLGAFTWKNQERIALLFAYIQKTGSIWLAAHFLLLTLCLNFPVTFHIARLTPHALYSRLYGENFSALLSESDPALMTDNEAVDAFNVSMLENGYGRNVLMPLLGIAFVLTLIIQIVFYLCTVFFMGLSRMNMSPLSFRDRMGLALYSSTLPVLAATLFGLYLPTVHIIIYYFIIIFLVFQRSKLCPDG